MKNVKYLAILLCAAAVLVGCSKGPKKPANLPKLFPATVTVTYDDGTPIDQATVAFRKPGGGSSEWNVTGRTGADGKLVLMTNGNWEGAPAGEYEVMIEKQISELVEPTEKGASVTVASTTNYIDKKYANPRTSGLTATITEGTNELTFKVGAPLNDAVQMLE